jgi:LacI family transcriptional regulator
MSRRIIMADVAQEAGVSLMTVSRVVNNKGDISEATRQRVREVIERLGYRPSGVARSLATNRTGTLGLVVPDNSNPFFSAFARGAEHLAYQEGYNIFLCNTEEETDREKAVIYSLEEKGVDGLILCSSRLEESDLREMVGYFPYVVLVNRQMDEEGIGTVLIDDTHSGKVAIEHLLNSGHRAIGMLAGPKNSYSGQQRVIAYYDTLRAAGHESDSELVANCSPRVEGGMQATQELLAAHPEITALFCFNDLVAVGVLKACAQMGLSVPDDIAVVGHDDVPLAQLVTPALTTCHVSQYEMGWQAVKLLLERISGCEEACKEVLVTPELVIRASAP